MRRISQAARLMPGIAALLLAACTYTFTPEATPEATRPGAGMPETSAVDEARRVSDVDLLGVITVANDTTAYDTPVGGLSAIAYDREDEVYYFLSDDRAARGPVRIYRATVDLSDGGLDTGDLAWTGLIRLLDEDGTPFATNTFDPEGLVFTGDHFYVASEGNAAARPPIAPAIVQFTPAGEFVATLPVPEKFIPLADGSRGVRNNLAFESLTRTPDGRYLITGVENALVQDGPTATLDDESPVRLLKIDLHDESVAAEPVYMVDAIPVAPEPADGYASNGLTELVALDNSGALLALERAFAEGVGNSIRLYLANTEGAMDTGNRDKLTGDGHEGEGGESFALDSPVAKELLVDFGELGHDVGIAPDNLEGLALGPQLPNGRQVLLAVSDNNFSASQTTQIWALALTLERRSTALPSQETMDRPDE